MSYYVNSITFSSRDYFMIHKLHEYVLRSFNNEGNVVGMLGDIGYSAEGLDNLLNVDDKVTDCQKVVIKRENVYCFYCEMTMCSILSMDVVIDMLKQKFSDKVYISFISEFIGEYTRLFVKDETGIFYPDVFKLEYCYNNISDVEYFTYYFDLVDFLKKIFPKADICYYDHIGEIKNNIDHVYGNVPNEEYFINIMRFEEYSGHNNIEVKEAA